MAASSAPASRLHPIGLVFALALAGLSVLAGRFVASLLQGSILGDLGWLSGFASVVAVLAIGDALWPHVAKRL